MTRLSVNIDHIATLRQARRAHEPDPISAAMLAILGGADGITLHLREDRRHIQDHDVLRMKHANMPRLNFEMATAEEIVQLALSVLPEEVTLVPEKRQELTTEGGLDLLANRKIVSETVARLKGAGIFVSLFIDPVREQLEVARAMGADAIEFQTASYSEAKSHAALVLELEKLKAATLYAKELGLAPHMGHGLNYHNVQAIMQIPGVEELNIGHSIVSRAVLVGMTQAVRDMKTAMATPRSA